MAKYVYPAVFEWEGNGYHIYFPDIENCFTSAKTLTEGMDMAQDVLCLMLYDREENGQTIPAPTPMQEFAVPDGAFASLISCDTLQYRRLYCSKAVKKTLSVPAWLNTLAEKNDINFSAVLQKGLKNELHIQ